MFIVLNEKKTIVHLEIRLLVLFLLRLSLASLAFFLSVSNEAAATAVAAAAAVVGTDLTAPDASRFVPEDVEATDDCSLFINLLGIIDVAADDDDAEVDETNGLNVFIGIVGGTK